MLCTSCLLFLTLRSDASRFADGKPDKLSRISQIFSRSFSPSLLSPFPRGVDAHSAEGRAVEEWRESATEAIRLRRQQRGASLFRNRSVSDRKKLGGNSYDNGPISDLQVATARRVNGSCSSSDDLHALLDDIVCSRSYLKALISAGKKCNLFGYFDSDHVRSCGVDSNGTYCRKHEREFPDPDYLAWDVLQQCSLQTTSGRCASNCKSSLANFAAKFGCCIHVSRVSWSVEDNPHILVLSSALWTFCGLTRPSTCANVPSLPPSTIAGSCTYGCYAYARSALICEGIGGQLIDTYDRCGRKGSALELGQLCGLNGNGMACFELQFSDNTDYLLSVYSACFKYFSSGACTEKCSAVLKRFRSRYGCCVNVYNGTAFGDSSQLLGSIVTGYGLWSRCSVVSPGMCSLPSEIESGNRTYNVQAFCDGILTGGAMAGDKFSFMFHLFIFLCYISCFHVTSQAV